MRTKTGKAARTEEPRATPLADVALLSPTNGEVLRPATPGDEVGGVSVPGQLRGGSAVLTDGELLWPVVEGIPLLRPKESLRCEVLGRLAAGEPDRALAVALGDQDRFAPTPPPNDDDLAQLIADDPSRGGGADLTLRQAMALLSYGPVGDYFAYRWVSPTYLSGLVLLGLVAARDRRVVEYACGIGHYLRALELLGYEAAGVDIVFSKLYLARRYLGVRGPLICGDVEASPVLAPSPADRTVFCHDAFYFFERKRAALTHLREVAGAGGALAVGHVHTRGDAHEAGFAESLGDYRARLDAGTALLDDAELARVWYGTGELPRGEAGESAPAVAWTEGKRLGEPVDWLLLARVDPGGLRQNPLLGAEDVDWPSAAWRREYEADAAAAKLGPYHLAELARRPRVAPSGRLGGGPQRTALASSPRELLRDRQLVHLPARW